MTEASATSPPPTSPDTSKSTSSPASEDGPSHSAMPDGETDLFGQPLAPVRPSAKRGSAESAQSAKAACLSGALAELASQCAPTAATPGTPTSAICGPKSGGSWPDADLQSALESRLRALLESTGSPLYDHRWKSLATLSGRPICRLRASARRISDNACFGWPTPKESDRNGTRELDSSRGMGLNDVAETAGWPTPMAGTPAQKGYNEAGNTDSGRKTVALASGWSTPTARDHQRGVNPPRAHDTGVPLSQQVAGWATPQATEARQGHQNRHRGKKGRQQSLTTEAVEALGPTSCTSDASTGKPAPFRLNPAFSLWLMGFPKRWMALAPSRASVRSGARAMRLFRTPPPHS